MDPAHPMSKFSVGNLDTLSDENGKSIRDDLLNFYNQHSLVYIMCLAVYGKEPWINWTPGKARFAGFLVATSRNEQPQIVRCFVRPTCPARHHDPDQSRKRSLAALYDAGC